MEGSGGGVARFDCRGRALWLPRCILSPASQTVSRVGKCGPARSSRPSASPSCPISGSAAAGSAGRRRPLWRRRHHQRQRREAARSSGSRSAGSSSPPSAADSARDRRPRFIRHRPLSGSAPRRLRIRRTRCRRLRSVPRGHYGRAHPHRLRPGRSRRSRLVTDSASARNPEAPRARSRDPALACWHATPPPRGMAAATSCRIARPSLDGAPRQWRSPCRTTRISTCCWTGRPRLHVPSVCWGQPNWSPDATLAPPGPPLTPPSFSGSPATTALARCMGPFPGAWEQSMRRATSGRAASEERRSALMARSPSVVRLATRRLLCAASLASRLTVPPVGVRTSLIALEPVASGQSFQPPRLSPTTRRCRVAQSRPPPARRRHPLPPFRLQAQRLRPHPPPQPGVPSRTLICPPRRPPPWDDRAV